MKNGYDVSVSKSDRLEDNHMPPSVETGFGHIDFQYLIENTLQQKHISFSVN
jgi:hypothetical protein